MHKRAPSPADRKARKQRACRARLARSRRKRGEVVAHIVIGEHPVIEALLKTGRLTEEQALHRSLVEAALGRLIAEWVSRCTVTRDAPERADACDNARDHQTTMNR
jgi:hypothetical protein